MRVLIQNCLKFCYLKSLGEWTEDPDEAMDFLSSEKALAFCIEHSVPAAQVVLRFGEDDKYDVRLPVGDDCKEGVASIV